MKSATTWAIEGAGWFPRQQISAHRSFRLHGWYGADKRLGVWMPGRVEDVTGSTDFDNSSQIHDSNGLAQVPHDPNIVGNKDHRQFHLLLQIEEEIQYLRLDVDIKG